MYRGTYTLLICFKWMYILLSSFMLLLSVLCTVVSCVNLNLTFLQLSFQPTVPIVYHKRSAESLQRLGVNVGVEWKPDSSMICISVCLVFFSFSLAIN